MVALKGERRKARGLALQALYEIDAASHQPVEVIDRLLAGSGLSTDNAVFVRQLVSGVSEHRSQIDDHIKCFAPAWPLEQIAVVDRNILRLAIFEVLIDNRVPIKVAINEAVELAKGFGSDSSPRFVNGVLSAVSTLATRQ